MTSNGSNNSSNRTNNSNNNNNNKYYYNNDGHICNVTEGRRSLRLPVGLQGFRVLPKSKGSLPYTQREQK